MPNVELVHTDDTGQYIGPYGYDGPSKQFVMQNGLGDWVRPREALYGC